MISTPLKAINPCIKRNLTEEQKEAARVRLAAAREKKG